MYTSVKTNSVSSNDEPCGRDSRSAISGRRYSLKTFFHWHSEYRFTSFDLSTETPYSTRGLDSRLAENATPLCTSAEVKQTTETIFENTILILELLFTNKDDFTCGAVGVISVLYVFEAVVGRHNCTYVSAS